MIFSCFHQFRFCRSTSSRYHRMNEAIFIVMNIVECEYKVAVVDFCRPITCASISAMHWLSCDITSDISRMRLWGTGMKNEMFCAMTKHFFDCRICSLVIHVHRTLAYDGRVCVPFLWITFLLEFKRSIYLLISLEPYFILTFSVCIWKIHIYVTCQTINAFGMRLLTMKIKANSLRLCKKWKKKSTKKNESEKKKWKMPVRKFRIKTKPLITRNAATQYRKKRKTFTEEAGKKRKTFVDRNRGRTHVLPLAHRFLGQFSHHVYVLAICPNSTYIHIYSTHIVYLSIFREA